MGRKRTREIKPVDRIGEEIDFDKYPVCDEHTDCFSRVEGRCTALKECGGINCVFYSPEEKALREAKEAYRRLKENKRYDLIRKYIKTLTALGVFDDEIDECGKTGQELDAFRDTDFAALMQEPPQSR